MSLFPASTRITDMMLGAAIFGGSNNTSATAIWEAGVGLDTEIAQLRRGDLDALSTLLTRYQNRLYRYLLRMVRQPAEAEDLFQQTWLRVAEKIHNYDQNRNFDAWLFTLARNLAIDHLRRLRPQSLDEPVGDHAAENPQRHGWFRGKRRLWTACWRASEPAVWPRPWNCCR